MSSIDQAFIKAFARRNRSSHPGSVTTAHPDAASGKPSAGATPLPSKAQKGTAPQNDFLRVDPSVDSSVELWTDQNEPRLVRVDSLKNDPIPAPHAVPKSRKKEPKSPEKQVDASFIATDANSSAANPQVELSKQIEKTTQHVRSIQDSLDLLQSSFTTLETFQQPSVDITQLYAADATATSPAKQWESTPEVETYDFGRDEEREQPEIVQRRIDSPADDSASSRDGADKNLESQTMLLYITQC